jgi:uncharacterized membrane protein YciS (DUF1049 family)
MTKPLLAVIFAMGMALTWLYIGNLKLENDLQEAVILQEAAETSLRTEKQKAELVATQIENFAIKSAAIEKQRDEARDQVNKMKDIFQDHDFAKLITKKPGLIENLMIKKTKEVFDEIEALTAE